MSSTLMSASSSDFGSFDEPTDDFNAVSFIDDRNGWVVGTGGTILATSDGGANWVRQQSGTDAHLGFVQFVDSRYGWAWGLDRDDIMPEEGPFLFVSTIDGGQTWHVMAKPPEPLQTVYFIDRNRGWAVSDYNVYWTNDSGKHWEVKPHPSGNKSPYNTIRALDANIAVIISADGEVFRTFNGGQEWIPGTPKLSLEPVYASFGRDESAFVICNDSSVWIGTAAGHLVEPTTKTLIQSVAFFDANTACAVGGQPASIRVSQDRGRTWARRTAVGIGNRFVSFITPLNVWTDSSDGDLLHSLDGGESWVHTDSPWPYLTSYVNFFDGGQIGVACDVSGNVFRSGDEGRTWARLTQERRTSNVRAIRFADQNTGWIAGEDGIFRTTDGGVTWQAGAKQTKGAVTSLFFIDALSGWAGDENGQLLHTSNGGKDWEVQYSLPPPAPADVQNDPLRAIVDIHFVNATTGWALWADGTIFPTTDGGKNWTERPFSLADSSTAVISRPPSPAPTPRRLEFADTRNGWAIDDKQVYHTADGGDTWSVVPRPGTTAPDEPTRLVALKVYGADDARVVDERGDVLRTTRGGNGTPVIEGLSYRWLPAPWYFASVLVLAGLSVPAMRRLPPPLAVPSVEDALASDRPLQPGEPDSLRFREVAAGLSLFLRNENTPPPLTIAITGPWGSGKSSLMNLLKADLQQYGFRPVWFNAWHHQKEEHLLAALLENVRAQCIPPLLRWPDIIHWPGVAFRWRLLALRFGRYWFIAILALSLLAVSSAYFLRTGTLPRTPDVSYAGFKDALKNPPDALKRATESHSALLAFVVGAVMLVQWVRRALTAFGLDPAKLIPRAAVAPAASDIAARTSFRHRFSKEFAEVTAALNPRSMLILIDDLDRCRPDAVLEILESVNFLVVSGDCYVVLGMDRARVEGCIGLGFKDVAEHLMDPLDRDPNSAANEEAHRRKNGPRRNYDDAAGNDGQEDVDSDNGADDADAPRLRRQRLFARQYLEKLINIEVPVPVAKPDQARAMLAPRYRRFSRQRPFGQPLTFHPWLARPDPRRTAKALAELRREWTFRRWKRLWRRKELRSGRRRARLAMATARSVKFLVTWPPLIATIAIVTLFITTLSWTSRQEASPQSAVVTRSKSATSAVPAKTEYPAATRRSASEAAASRDAGPVESRFIAGHGKISHTAAWAIFAAGSVMLLVGAAWALQRADETVVTDSGDFRKALAIWHPLIYGQRTTPRSLKRYLNHVRYYAMCQRTHGRTPDMLERLRDWWRTDAGTSASGPKLKRGSIPEPSLVALGALYYFHPDWLRDAKKWGIVKEGRLPTAGKGESDDNTRELADRLIDALAQHKQSFLASPFSDEFRALLLEIYPSIEAEE